MQNTATVLALLSPILMNYLLVAQDVSASTFEFISSSTETHMATVVFGGVEPYTHSDIVSFSFTSAGSAALSFPTAVLSVGEYSGTFTRTYFECCNPGFVSHGPNEIWTATLNDTAIESENAPDLDGGNSGRFFFQTLIDNSTFSNKPHLLAFYPFEDDGSSGGTHTQVVGKWFRVIPEPTTSTLALTATLFCFSRRRR